MTIKFFTYLKDYTHTAQTSMDEGETVEELLDLLCRRYGRRFENSVFKDNELGEAVIIHVNGRHIKNHDGIRTRLKPEDVVSIVPVVSGDS